MARSMMRYVGLRVSFETQVFAATSALHSLLPTHGGCRLASGARLPPGPSPCRSTRC